MHRVVSTARARRRTQTAWGLLALLLLVLIGQGFAQLAHEQLAHERLSHGHGARRGDTCEHGSTEGCGRSGLEAEPGSGPEHEPRTRREGSDPHQCATCMMLAAAVRSVGGVDVVAIGPGPLGLVGFMDEPTTPRPSTRRLVGARARGPPLVLA